MSNNVKIALVATFLLTLFVNCSLVMSISNKLLAMLLSFCCAVVIGLGCGTWAMLMDEAEKK
jgi:hypothetical protein